MLKFPKDARFVVPYWYSFFFISIGFVHFLFNAFNFYMLTRGEIIDISIVDILNERNPAYLPALAFMTIFDLIVIALGWYMAFHAESVPESTTP